LWRRVYQRAVRVRTVVALLRLRYKLQRRSQVEQFAEEVIAVTAHASRMGQVAYLMAYPFPFPSLRQNPRQRKPHPLLSPILDQRTKG
jgi:hypothetical protein